MAARPFQHQRGVTCACETIIFVSIMTVAEWGGFCRPLRNIEQPKPTKTYAILCKDLY